MQLFGGGSLDVFSALPAPGLDGDVTSIDISRYQGGDSADLGGGGIVGELTRQEADQASLMRLMVNVTTT